VSESLDKMSPGLRKRVLAAMERDNAAKAGPKKPPLPPPDAWQANKYHAKGGTKGGEHVDSKDEGRWWDVLIMREKAGEISDLQRQVTVDLCGLAKTKVDFSYVEDGARIWHEFKGFGTPRWRVILSIWRQVGPGLLRVTYRRRGGVDWPTDEYIPKVSSALAERAKEK